MALALSVDISGQRTSPGGTHEHVRDVVDLGCALGARRKINPGGDGCACPRCFRGGAAPEPPGGTARLAGFGRGQAGSGRRGVIMVGDRDRRGAQRCSCRREVMPSLAKITLRCHSTVRRLMNSRSAIS
jgi:hypothetical protein